MGQEQSTLHDNATDEQRHPRLLKNSSKHKGLRNEAGQNNCFLNVIIQTIWHLASFRTLISTTSHVHPENVQCILCKLQELFTHYEYGNERVLSPDEMRITLGILGANESRFQLGEMDDATEALDCILQFIHTDHIELQRLLGSILSPTSSKADPVDVICEPRCIAHALFECNMFDIYKCRKCDANSEPELWRDTLYRIYVSEVVLNTGDIMNSPFKFAADEFNLSKAMQRIANVAPSRSCPDNTEESMNESQCSGRTRVERWILKLPLVFGVSLVWESMSTTQTQLKCILSIIAQQRLDLRSLFHFGGEAADATSAFYQFRGLVCFYGRHYVSFFYSSRTQEWYLFDDSQVKVVGSWKTLQDRILKGSYQPTLLFWEKEDLDAEEVQTVAKRLDTMCHSKADEVQEEVKVEADNSPEDSTPMRLWEYFDVNLVPINDVSDSGIAIEQKDSSYFVARFEKDRLGNTQTAEASGKIKIGDEIISINSQDITGTESLENVLQILESATFPLKLFMRRERQPDNRWTCRACTLLNPADALICEVCGSRRQLQKVD